MEDFSNRYVELQEGPHFMGSFTTQPEDKPLFNQPFFRQKPAGMRLATVQAVGEDLEKDSQRKNHGILICIKK